MKRIFSCIVILLLMLLTGCNQNKNDLEDVTNYITQLDSYSLDCDMTIYRGGKEIKADINVDYLKPDFYKVIFKNPNGYDQVILKNKSGVFVLTPGLDKEFKFNSEWPLNTAHAYLINTVVSDIKADTDKTSEVTDDNLIVTAKIGVSSQYYSKLVMSYDLKNNKPNYVNFVNDKNETIVKAIFKSFTANPSLSESNFNEDKVKKDFERPTINEKSGTIVVDYIIEGTALKSKSENEQMTIMCYSGVKNYTIVIRNNVEKSIAELEAFNSYELIEAGLLLKANSYYRCYLKEYEIDVYTNTLDYTEVISIVNGIKMS